uniref:RBPJ-interacting and tubulin-associated protein n=1 Tax=Heterorhabditis bacteriophora TaxID=37862 RepID=A0A1I7X6Z4_HETBA
MFITYNQRIIIGFLEPRHLPQRSTPTSPSGAEWVILDASEAFGTQFLRASKALRKPLTTSGWTRPELPSGKGSSPAPECRTPQKRPKLPTLPQKGRWALSAEANASARETPEKTRGKLTSKLTILGVFQTYRPRPWKLTDGSVDCNLTRE